MKFGFNWPGGFGGEDVGKCKRTIHIWENFFCAQGLNHLIWPKFEFIQDFMPILVTCKFDENPIKNDEAIDRTVKYGLSWHSRASNSEVKGLAHILIHPRFYAFLGYLKVW